jgi:hypothetical protein
VHIGLRWCHVLLDDAQSIFITKENNYCLLLTVFFRPFASLSWSHGPVDFAQDIEAVVVHHRHRGDKSMVNMIEQFATKNKCNVIWMEPGDV